MLLTEIRKCKNDAALIKYIEDTRSFFADVNYGNWRGKHYTKDLKNAEHSYLVKEAEKLWYRLRDYEAESLRTMDEKALFKNATDAAKLYLDSLSPVDFLKKSERLTKKIQKLIEQRESSPEVQSLADNVRIWLSLKERKK